MVAQMWKLHFNVLDFWTANRETIKVPHTHKRIIRHCDKGGLIFEPNVNNLYSSWYFCESADF